MSTSDEQPDTYPWRAAPSHLMTRRQLRAADLAPGGADPVALMVREAAGRKRRRMWAYLFDSRTAIPKRTATPAQLNAVEKAVRGRKLRAAQRRGLTEADLTQPGDPGPGWTTDPSPTEKEAPMNDNHPTSQDEIRDHAQHLDRMLDEALRNAPVYVENATPEYEAEAASSAEMGVRAQERFEEYLQQHRDVLGEEPQWRSYFESFDRNTEAEEVAERIHDSMADDADSTSRLSPAQIADQLRDLHTGEQATELLQTHKLDRAGLLAVAEQFELTRLEQLTGPKIAARLAQQVSARRKYAILRDSQSWKTTGEGQVGEIAAITDPVVMAERATELEKQLNLARRGQDGTEIAGAREALLEHLSIYRGDIEDDPHWDPYFSRIDHRNGPEPVGQGQRLARLHVLAAINRSREDRENRDARLATAARMGASEEDLDVARAAARTGAETRMAQIPWHNPDACSMMLGEALTWREESPRAAERADQLIASYAASWGVIVDPLTGSVRIDPDHDAPARQEYAEAAAVWAREQAAVGAIAAAPLTPAGKAAVEQALQRWSGDGVDPQAPRAHVDSQDARRVRLAADLDAAKLSESDRAIVDFTVDYLRGDTRDLDLLDTPVAVDPGVEARGRMGALLARYAGKSASARVVTEDLAVMSPPDQETVREIGRAIKAGERPNLDPWPEFVDREELLEAIQRYALDAEEQHMEADFLVEEDYESDQIGVSDDIGARIERMAGARDHLRTIAVEGKGLAPIERAQLTAVLDDIDIGYISRESQLPEMMWADERSKAELDYLRSSAQADQVKRQFTESVTRQVDGSGAQPSEQAASSVRAAVGYMGDTLYTVGCGMTEGVDKAREEFLTQRTELGHRLAQAGVGADSMGAIRADIDTTARQAGVLGRTAAQRSDRWQARTEQIVVQRNDSLAQQQAAASGRGSRGGRTSKSASSDRGKPTSTPAPVRNHVAGRRQLHTPEVGR